MREMGNPQKIKIYIKASVFQLWLYYCLPPPPPPQVLYWTVEDMYDILDILVYDDSILRFLPCFTLYGPGFPLHLPFIHVRFFGFLLFLFFLCSMYIYMEHRNKMKKKKTKKSDMNIYIHSSFLQSILYILFIVKLAVP